MEYRLCTMDFKIGLSLTLFFLFWGEGLCLGSLGSLGSPGSLGSKEMTLQEGAPVMIQNGLQLKGEKGRPAVMKFKVIPPLIEAPKGKEVLSITEPTLVYLPPSTEVVSIERKTYKNENFASQIENHYIRNYLVYGLIYVFVAVSRYIK